MATSSSEGTQTIEQQRAAFARDCIVSALEENAVGYTAVAQELPSRIQRSGIGQTVAFLMVKKARAKTPEKCPEGLVLRDLEQWLVQRRQVFRCSADGSLMDRLLAEPRRGWLRAEREGLEIAVWLKRFAEALMPKLDESESPSDE